MWRSWCTSAALYARGKCQATIGTVKIAPATSGRVAQTAIRRTDAGRSTLSTTAGGVPYSSSGGNSSIRARCCTMWALNR